MNLIKLNEQLNTAGFLPHTFILLLPVLLDGKENQNKTQRHGFLYFCFIPTTYSTKLVVLGFQSVFVLHPLDLPD